MFLITYLFPHAVLANGHHPIRKGLEQGAFRELASPQHIFHVSELPKIRLLPLPDHQTLIHERDYQLFNWFYQGYISVGSAQHLTSSKIRSLLISNVS